MYSRHRLKEVLLKIDEIGPTSYQILVERKNRLDVMTITVELIDDRLLDRTYAKLSELETRIKSALKSAAWTCNLYQACGAELFKTV